MKKTSASFLLILRNFRNMIEYQNFVITKVMKSNLPGFLKLLL
jgi:hypothetical protein